VPSAHYVHPEFGYLCPTPRLRRELRVAIVSILLGTVIGAGLVAFGRDHNTDVVFTMTHVGTSSDEPMSASVADAMAVGVEIGANRTDLTAVEANTTDGKRTDPRKTETLKTETSKTDASKTGTSKADASKTACEDSTWTYLDGSCIPGKPRRVKVRAATDRPAIAAAPLGRSAAAPLDAAAPPPAAAAALEAAPAQASEASPAATPSATPPAATSQPAVAAHKKPQRTARSHRRNDSEGSARDDSRGRGYVVYDYGRGAYGEPVIQATPWGWLR